MLKKVVTGIVVLIVVVVAVGVVGFFYLNRVVKFGVEKGGSMALGVRTQLADTDISLWEGTAGIEGLRLSSPQGYEAKHMCRIGKARIHLDIRSLFGKDVHVREVAVDGAHLTLEFRGTDTNWQTLMERLKEGREKKGAKPERRLRIDRMVLENIHVEVQGLPVEVSGGLEIESLKLKGLSTADGRGLTPRQLLLRIIPAVVEAAMQKLQGVAPGKQLQDATNQLQDTLSDVAPTEGAGSSVEEGAENLKGTVEGLVGGEEDEQSK